MTKHRDLYTDRQLVALTTFSDLVAEAREHVLADAFAADLPAGPSVSEASPDDSATASSYADAVATFLACAVSRLVDYSNNLTTWNETNENVRNLFQRQAVPMVWDFSEANVVDGDLTIAKTAEWVASSLALVCASSAGEITVRQLDARRALPSDVAVLVSTDLPLTTTSATRTFLTSSTSGFGAVSNQYTRVSSRPCSHRRCKSLSQALIASRVTLCKPMHTSSGGFRAHFSRSETRCITTSR